jgi:L-lactate dehydrogenase
MKIGIIGAGRVGQACLEAAVTRGSATEIVLVDRTREKAEGMVTDITYGATLCPPVTLRAGDYADYAGAGLVMFTAGLNEKSGGATDRADPEGRLKLLAKNAEIYRDLVPQIARAAPEAILLVVTDPPDALANVARNVAPKLRIISTGTFLDSLRFRAHLARKLQVHPASVDANVVGEHGTSSVFLWSSARIGSISILDALGEDAHTREQIEKEVRQANIKIIEGTGASQLGIAIVCARITEIVARDERAVLPIGSYIQEFGVTLSLPCVLGRSGIQRVIRPSMAEEEASDLQKSAQHITDALQKMGSG